MEEAARITELEGALQSAISYLRRLPIHPMTYQAIKDAEAVLNRQVVALCYRTQSYTPAGALILSASVQGRVLTVSTEALTYPVPAGFPEHKDMLYSMLIRGVTLPPLVVGE